jgi:GxxExxY protein
MGRPPYRRRLSRPICPSGLSDIRMVPGRFSIKYGRQVRFLILYKGGTLGEYRIDLLVDDPVILGIKYVERSDPVFEAQVLRRLKGTSKRVGLLIDFSSPLLRDEIKRFIL